jgi:hypothetical protein
MAMIISVNRSELIGRRGVTSPATVAGNERRDRGDIYRPVEIEKCVYTDSFNVKYEVVEVNGNHDVEWCGEEDAE